MSRYHSLDDEEKDKFVRLASEMSPENLSCDGMRSGVQAVDMPFLRRRWFELERTVGFIVSEEEVWEDVACEEKESLARGLLLG